MPVFLGPDEPVVRAAELDKRVKMGTDFWGVPTFNPPSVVSTERRSQRLVELAPPDPKSLKSGLKTVVIDRVVHEPSGVQRM
jgi:hypothetical protein